MKKCIRMIAVVTCIALIGVLLCSCQYLDEKKANHAVYCDDSKTSFTFRGNTYKKITLPSNLIFIESDDVYEEAYVTDGDVPVLLSKIYGKTLQYRMNEEHPVVMQSVSGVSGFSSVFSIQFAFEDNDGASGTFVREDKYDAVEAKIKDAKLEDYYIEKWNYDDNNKYSYESYEYDAGYTITRELVSDEVRKAVNDTLKNGKKLNYQKLDGDEYDSVTIIPCDKDLLLTNNNYVIFFREKNDYYLLQTLDGTAFGKEVVKAPEKYTKLFDKLYQEYRDTVFPSDPGDYFASMEDLEED